MQWRRIAEPDAIDSGDEAQRSGADSELEGDGGLRCCNRRKYPQQQAVRRSTQRTPRSFTVPFFCRVSFLWPTAASLAHGGAHLRCRSYHFLFSFSDRLPFQSVSLDCSG
ncbi:unnamed protein product [Ectocarpus sp. 4 AP-2014]